MLGSPGRRTGVPMRMRAAVRALVSVEPMCVDYFIDTLFRRHPPHACACLSVRNGAEHGTETVRSQVTQARPPCEASECARNIACPFARLGNVRPHLCAPVCAPPAVRPRLVEVVSACRAPSAAVLVCAFMVGLHWHDCCGGTVGRRRRWRSWRYEPAHSGSPGA